MSVTKNTIDGYVYLTGTWAELQAGTSWEHGAIANPIDAIDSNATWSINTRKWRGNAGEIFSSSVLNSINVAAWDVGSTLKYTANGVSEEVNITNMLIESAKNNAIDDEIEALTEDQDTLTEDLDTLTDRVDALDEAVDRIVLRNTTITVLPAGEVTDLIALTSTKGIKAITPTGAGRRYKLEYSLLCESTSTPMALTLKLGETTLFSASVTAQYMTRRVIFYGDRTNDLIWIVREVLNGSTASIEISSVSYTDWDEEADISLTVNPTAESKLVGLAGSILQE
jgi:hypothetical protein